MHFSKTYSQLLLTLPQELQQNAIEYRQLKKLINKVVNELATLGLNPSVLHTLLQSGGVSISGDVKGKRRALGERPGELVNGIIPGQNGSNDDVARPPPMKAVYEVVVDGEHLLPRLRIVLGSSNDNDDGGVTFDIHDRPRDSNSTANISLEPPDEMMLVSKPIISRPGESLIWTLQNNGRAEEDMIWTSKLGDSGERHDELSSVLHPDEDLSKRVQVTVDGSREIVIPLVSDSAFFDLLYAALQTLSSHLFVVRSNFVSSLEALARAISRTARPQSALPGFHPKSSSSDPQDVTAPLISPFSTSFLPGGKTKNDLYAWREIFQLYVEAEIFESVKEMDRGERDIEETEKRLTLFAEQVTARGLNDRRKMKVKESRDALENFLQLNVLLVNLKKFQFANAEATRKILKKHAKRTALPFPSTRAGVPTKTSPAESQLAPLIRNEQSDGSAADILSLIPTATTSLPHLLVQAIGETLLPIIPHLDDYSCLICTSIAFKPIRLTCGHLFCVRCLVKMQKRGQDNCPCCRAPTVLKADRSNVDWAMLNFMQDWFPQEAATKLKQNEKEAAQEQLEELGITDQGCVVA